jgi:hypothetical protein
MPRVKAKLVFTVVVTGLSPTVNLLILPPTMNAQI